MTRQEAISTLFWLKWHLKDAGFSLLAMDAEDCEMRLHQGDSAETMKLYSRFILPEGRRGRVRLILSNPYEARATALIFGILNTIED